MTEDQLRALVREALARHLGQAAPAVVSSGEPSWKTHASHYRLPVLVGAEGDGPCLIEPAVTCTHCAYCQSLGH
jgi:hypothetical protein